jgi:hypothetical protein
MSQPATIIYKYDSCGTGYILSDRNRKKEIRAGTLTGGTNGRKS